MFILKLHRFGIENVRFFDRIDTITSIVLLLSPLRAVGPLGRGPERKQILIIPGPGLAYEVCPSKSCSRSIKTAPLKFGNLAPGPACKSRLRKRTGA
jgi:hypothetical protein